MGIERLINGLFGSSSKKRISTRHTAQDLINDMVFYRDASQDDNTRNRFQNKIEEICKHAAGHYEKLVDKTMKELNDA